MGKVKVSSFVKDVLDKVLTSGWDKEAQMFFVLKEIDKQPKYFGFHQFCKKENISIRQILDAIEHGYELIRPFVEGDIVLNKHNDLVHVGFNKEINGSWVGVGHINEHPNDYRLLVKAENKEKLS